MIRLEKIIGKEKIDDKYYAYESVQEAIWSGYFAPDTPPVPTIKPGDKVRYKSWQFKHIDIADVDHLRLGRLNTFAVILHDGESYVVPLEHLEVVE